MEYYLLVHDSTVENVLVFSLNVTKYLKKQVLRMIYSSFVLIYLHKFCSPHGWTLVNHKHYILWYSGQARGGKEVYKVSIHNLKVKKVINSKDFKMCALFEFGPYFLIYIKGLKTL